MSENTKLISSVDKICQETECVEKREALSADAAVLFKSFTFCPYCAEEMTLVCNNCHEQLNGSDFKYCPWCGAEFAEAESA